MCLQGKHQCVYRVNTNVFTTSVFDSLMCYTHQHTHLDLDITNLTFNMRNEQLYKNTTNQKIIVYNLINQCTNNTYLFFYVANKKINKYIPFYLITN